MTEKQAGGDVLGGLAGLAARPFVGRDRSQAIQNKVIGGVTNYVNRPIENALRRTGVHKAISKAYEVGTYPIPNTPRLVQPVMPDIAQRRAYGNWRADDIVHTFANNPEVIGALAVPAPGVGTSYLAGKSLLGRGLKKLTKLAAYTSSFADELEKIANGDMLQYFQDHPEKLKEKQERDRRKKELEKTAKVGPYQQKTQWTCSAACLKAVLEHWGTKLPELTIIQAIGAKKGRGAECDEIAAAARKLGFSAFEYSFESLDQAKVLLDQDIPIICDIQSFNNPGKGHYVVMTGVWEGDVGSGSRVEIMDPNTPGNGRTISREEMDERWWDRAMAPPHDLMPKWGIVVVPPEDAGGVS
jgi:predicted double-glycine peptidase